MLLIQGIKWVYRSGLVLTLETKDLTRDSCKRFGFRGVLECFRGVLEKPTHFDMVFWIHVSLRDSLFGPLWKTSISKVGIVSGLDLLERCQFWITLDRLEVLTSSRKFDVLLRNSLLVTLGPVLDLLLGPPKTAIKIGHFFENL